MPVNPPRKAQYGDVECTLRTVVTQARDQLYREGQRGVILPYTHIAQVTGIDRKVLFNLVNDRSAKYDRKVFARLVAFFGGLTGQEGTVGIQHFLRYIPPLTASSQSAPPSLGEASATPRFFIASALPEDCGDIHCTLEDVLTQFYGRRTRQLSTSSYNKWGREVGRAKDTVWAWASDRIQQYQRGMLAYWCYLTWSKAYTGPGDGTIASILRYIPPGYVPQEPDEPQQVATR